MLTAESTTLRRVRNAEEVAETVLSTDSVTSINVTRNPWRIPSAASITDLIGSRQHLIEELPWLVGPEKLDSALLEVRAEVVRLEEQLARLPPPSPNRIRLRHVGRHPVDFSPADQVVTASSATTLFEIKKALEPYGQCLPFPRGDTTRFFGPHGGSLRDLIDFNLPHALEAQCGSWRDWLLGMTVVLADGRIVKSGSHAVKNVAGYDVHKLTIGARGTLGIISEVILRTFPVAALPNPSVQVNYEYKGWRECGPLLSRPRWIQRTLRTDFDTAVAGVGNRLLEADWASSTLCAQLEAEESLPRYQGDWVIRSRAGARNLEITDPTQIRLMKRTKEIFDPTGKLNPGEMGIF
jgi:hypothetical protein